MDDSVGFVGWQGHQLQPVARTIGTDDYETFLAVLLDLDQANGVRPLSELARQTAKVTEMTVDHDVILSRRGEAEDLYLSTRDRHEREAQAQLITTTMLAWRAHVRTWPVRPWSRRCRGSPGCRRTPVACLQELLNDLHAAAHTAVTCAASPLLAAAPGLEPRQLGYRRDRALGIAHSLRLAHSLQLAHTLGVAE